MPHSKRKKKENHRPKRIEITDDEGWTHVTSTTPARPHRDLKANPGFNWNDDAVGWKRMVEEAPPNVTLEKLLGQYKRCEKRFRESSCWKRFEKDLQQRLSDRSTVDNCVCFGLGSPSAPSYQLDRRDVSLYQLAAFKAITELLQRRQPDRPLSAFAQEPIFNTLDIKLLEALSVSVLESPAGFLHLTTNSFAFAPGHEQYVLLRILHYDPALFFGHSLDPYLGRDGRWRVPSCGTHIQVLTDSSDEEAKERDLKGLPPKESFMERENRKYKEANPPLHEDNAYKKPVPVNIHMEDGKQYVYGRRGLLYVDGQRVSQDEGQMSGDSSESFFAFSGAMVDSPSESSSIIRPGEAPPSGINHEVDEGEPGNVDVPDEDMAWIEALRIGAEQGPLKTKMVPAKANPSDLSNADVIVSYLVNKASIKMPDFEEHDHAFHDNWIRFRLPQET